jgi:nucleoside 2-deoxyribosyltransferase
MRIYLSAPLFSQAETAFNAQLTQELEEQGFDVFPMIACAHDLVVEDEESLMTALEAYV